MASEELSEILPDLHKPLERVEFQETSPPKGELPLDWHEFADRYYNDPVQFFRDFWKKEPYKWQKRALQQLALGHKALAIRSGHRKGKSTFCGCVIAWWIFTRHPQRTAVTAPTEKQLYDVLYSECIGGIKKLPPELRELLDFNKERIWYKATPEDSYVSFKTAGQKSAEALAGAHSEHTLLICDEASAIPPQAFDSAGSVMAGPDSRMIIIGNPTKSTGYFYDAFHKDAESWELMHIEKDDEPQVAQTFIDRVIRRHGIESNEYRFRILGEFPLSDDNTLISAIDVEFAMKRTAMEVPLDTQAPLIFGVDPARFGDDSTVLCIRQGNVVLDEIFWSGWDLMSSVGRIVSEAEKYHPQEICIDSNGIGAGAADRLRELNFQVFDVNVQERTAMNPTCDRLRDELWWSIREWLQTRNVRLPHNERLRVDLCAPTYKYLSNGKIKVESKDELKKPGRLGRSPDFADALGCTFAGLAAKIGGGFSHAQWNSPEFDNYVLPGIV